MTASWLRTAGIWMALIGLACGGFGGGTLDGTYCLEEADDCFEFRGDTVRYFIGAHEETGKYAIEGDVLVLRWEKATHAKLIERRTKSTLIVYDERLKAREVWHLR